MTRAVVVIDVQESFRRQEIWAASSNPEIVGSVRRLVEDARERGDLVVWVLHAEPGSGTVFDPASGFVRLMDGLEVRDGEPVLTKSSHNAFTTTNLQQVLTLRGVREVVVCGIRTEQCCETTARLASDLGYAVTFVVDATATTPIPHRDAPRDRPVEEVLADPLTLGTDEIIERTVYALAGRFAKVRTVGEVVATAPVGG
ncbi:MULTISPECIES: cysteine hydrolase family protein [Thermomonospora]|uniref:Nicotinamidase-related amidase n=1 Tax=Thermomonospora cellulosilytica TaxID=1411118 RepID=A0A7W3R8M6_9ACTN|nr:MULTISPECIES: isochorismatase family protein [Thermomonospora]MBA9003827.1 nicotinamidase-related amidase [Thermomonospora cellulosilytica]